MAQGDKLVKKSTASTSSRKQSTGHTKKGAKFIAPKKSTLVQAQKLKRQLSAKINRNIEESMAVKANSLGKLTILKKTAQQAEQRGKNGTKKKSK